MADVDGWPVGLWEAAQHLRRRGICVDASQNDPHLVQARWHDAAQPPFVSFTDFVIPQIGWRAKAERIQHILNCLSLTPESAVLVDDSRTEREAVKAALPGIREIGEDPLVLRRVLLWCLKC